MTVRHDVAHMREVEEALRRSEAKYREIFENIQDVFFQTNDRGLIVEVSPSAERYGYTREELIGMPATRVYEDPSKRITLLQLLEDGDITDREVRLRARDGRVLDLSISAHMLRGPDGSPAGMEGCLRDISDRKRAEEALRLSERELAIRNRIADSFLTVPDEEMYGEALQVVLEALGSRYGVFGYIDEDGAIVCASMTRDVWDQCQIPYKDIVFPPDRWGGIWGRALTEKKSRYSNEPGRVPEGHIPILNSLAVPIIHRRKVIGLLHVANKETAYDEDDREMLETIAGHIAPILHARLQRDRQERRRRRAEEALKRHRDRLEELIDERTAELTRTNERLLREAGERRRAEAMTRAQRDLAVALGAISDLQDALRSCLQAAMRVSGMDCGGVYLIDRASGALSLAYHEGLSADFVESASHYAPDSASARLVRAGKPAYAVHQELGVPLDQNRLAEGLRATAILPVHHDGQVIACLNVASHLLDEVPAAGRDALEAIAAQVGSSITRVRALEALRRSEQHFSKAFHASPLSIVMATMSEGRIVDVNEGFLQMTGYGREELIGRTTLELGILADAEERAWMVREVLKRGSAPNWELKIRTKSGEMRDLLTAFVAIELEGVPCLLGMSRDVTEHKRAEEALRESEERFRAIVENAPFGYYRVGNDGLWQYVNPVWERMHGCSLDDVIGKSFEITQTREDVEEARQNVKRALAGETITGEFSRITRQGTIEYHTFNIQPVRQGNEIVAIEGFINDITKRKRAEEALLRQSHDLGERVKELRSLFEISKLVQRPGISLEEILRGTVDLIPPGWEYLEVACARIVFEGREFRTENFRETAWRQTADIIVNSQRTGAVEVCYLGEKPEADEGPFLKQERDLINAIAERLGRITERKRAEEALRQSEQRFRQVLDVSSDLVYKTNLESGTFDYVSPAVLSLTGFTPQEVIDMGLRGVFHRVHPEDWQHYKRDLEGLLDLSSEARRALRLEFRWQCKDGEYRWFADSRAVVRGDDGQPLAVVGTIRDTTERRQAEEALRESEERFRTLSASAPIGIMLVDNKDGMVYCNERLLAIYGLPLEETLGFGWVKYVHPDDREALLAERSEAMAEGREFVREFRIVSPQGETRWVRARTTTVSSQEGMSNTRVGTLEDITERRQAEEQARQLQAEHVRANELRRMVRILEQMAATLGHELRNPLGVISNSVYFLANQAQIDGPKAQKHVLIIGREVVSAKRVIDDILEFAHVPQLLPAAAGINAVVDSALTRSHIPANIRVLRKLAVDLSPLVCDEERLERAFIDIIANAVQAMPHGGRLGVNTRQSGDKIQVVFSDSGEGIAPENLDKVFEPMFTTKLRGIGLGLTVVRRTVEQHGGEISVRSRPGEGAVFAVVLPRDCRPFGAEGGRVA